MTPSSNAYMAVILGLIGGIFCWRVDTRRRKLRLHSLSRRIVLSVLDVACTSFFIVLAITLFILAPHLTPAEGLFTVATLGASASVLIWLFLWSEGRQQVHLQRPAGLVFAEGAILIGFYQAVAAVIFHDPLGLALGAKAGIPILVGAITLLAVLPPFLSGREEHRILESIDLVGEHIRAEYAASTPECPFPERWNMLDAQSAATEVLDFLKAFIIMVKPELVLETGTFIGHSAMKMAEGMKANGFGKIITIEYDPLVFAKAKQNIDASGLREWIECRNASSLDTVVEGSIDILFSDSDLNIRESEIRRFLPQIKSRGLVLVHDASSSFKVVREAVLRLEEEGLLSVVLISTPRGMVIAQKRQGRT